MMLEFCSQLAMGGIEDLGSEGRRTGEHTKPQALILEQVDATVSKSHVFKDSRDAQAISNAALGSS